MEEIYTLPHVYEDRYRQGKWVSLLTAHSEDKTNVDKYSNKQTPKYWYKKLTRVLSNSPYDSSYSYKPYKAIKDLDIMSVKENLDSLATQFPQKK